MFLGRIILSSLPILCLCACGNGHDGISENGLTLTSTAFSNENNEDLKNTINDTMMALKNLDMDKFNAYTNNRQTMVTPWGTENVEYTLFGELCEEKEVDSDEDLVYQLDNEIVKNLSWEILDIVQDNDTAQLKLRITNLNMEGIVQRVKTDTELINEIRKIPPDDTKAVVLKLEAERQNEKWVLLVNVDFANAISANIWVVDPENYLNENLSYDNTDFLPQFVSHSITYEGIASVSKEQKIEIISATDNAITQIIDLHEITNFLNQEEMHNWIIAESIPDNSRPILSIVRYALERKTENPQLKEQSRHTLYQAEDIYYIEDGTEYSYTDMPDFELPRYYEIPSNVGEYLKQFLQ